MSNRKISEQYLVNQIKNNKENTDSGTRRACANVWKDFIIEQVEGGLSDSMEKVVWRCGYQKNRGRAVGIFIGDDELLKIEDFGHIARYSDEKKRGSLIDAFQWPAEISKYGDFKRWEPVSRAVIIPGIVKILNASAVPNPNGVPLNQYVEIKCRKNAARIRRDAQRYAAGVNSD